MSRRRKGYRAARDGEAFVRAVRMANETDGTLGLRQVQERLSEMYHERPLTHDRIGEFADLCTTCGEHGHWSRECPHNTCRRCGAAGHFARSCPTPPA